MREIIIKENEAGQRLDKFLAKYMKKAPRSFFYKMLRKKNIVLNGKKADGKEKLACRDVVRLYLSEETIQSFSETEQERASSLRSSGSQITLKKRHIVYEDENLLLLNKPAGVLSQRAEAGEDSMVEAVIRYLLSSGQLTQEDLRTFRPSVCNRLDRNTSGLIAAGKSLAGLQELSSLFRSRDLRKYYLTLVKGTVKKEAHIRGWLSKDPRTNTVRVTKSEEPDSLFIETSYHPAEHFAGTTLLEVHLITGRAHQIRAHLSSIGHPVIGDYKYGNRQVNDRYKERFGLSFQLLHSSRMEFPQMEGPLSGLSGRTFTAPIPELFQRILDEERQKGSV